MTTKRLRGPEFDSGGRPRYRPDTATYETRCGISVHRLVTRQTLEEINTGFTRLLESLDEQRGCVFRSAYEYPGRYSRWSVGFQCPPIGIESRGRRVWFLALNGRGKVMLPWIVEHVQRASANVMESIVWESDEIAVGIVKQVQGRFVEEERSKQASVFSVIRLVIDLFGTDGDTDPQLGLYGAFGYDLTFQFEPVIQKHARSEMDGDRDMVVYLPDDILVHDVQAGRAWRLQYDFSFKGQSTNGLDRGVAVPGSHNGKERPKRQAKRDHAVGEYSASVNEAKKQFKCGNLFECVLSQTFEEPCAARPSDIFFRLCERNPSPYLFLVNLGRREHLVGASPEMFVRVERTNLGLRCETCPISGTIRRGADALQDADRVYEILASDKDKSELTMCTDVDRNDKSRVCVAGSVKVVGRRQIEQYSKLIHTVDHVEGYLRPGFDALDAFLVHTWAVTVSGAPKTWAIQFIEDTEKSQRAWYGGAVGIVGFDGHLNTGLTIRTVRLVDGVAQVRAGATLLWDSIPEEEEKETELKASAMLEAVQSCCSSLTSSSSTIASSSSSKATGNGLSMTSFQSGQGKRVLLVDHEDSFVHTLANYLRQTGAEVTTVRAKTFCKDDLNPRPDLVVLSPGPGTPKHFDCSKTLGMLTLDRIPTFGVCLGLQAMVEHFGGELGVLDYPMHGKPSIVRLVAPIDETLAGLPQSFPVARYHSLYATKMPDVLRATAYTNALGEVPIQLAGDAAPPIDFDVVMAIRHKTLPMSAVQFHPESILTSHEHGMLIINNALRFLQ